MPVLDPRLDSVGTTLLRAASDLLAAEGPSALTVRRIAADAGVSTMNVYSRFGGKDGVIEHLFVAGFTELGAGMDAAAETDDPVADLRLCGTAYRTFALANATTYSIMFDRAVPDFVPSDAALEVAGATLGKLAARIQRVMDAGMFAAADPLQTAAVVWATCHGVVSLELRHVGPQPLVDWAVVYDQAIAAISRGLRA
jgi:AcrR family transcriptional regulator